MNKKILVACVLSGTLLLAGCEDVGGSQSSINYEQSKLLSESNRQLGMPNITNFFEKETAKKIWELRDNPDLTTYAYSKTLDGEFVYLGRAIGFGLPYTTQYTNPEEYYSNGATIPQADPNGLYSSETTNATWLMLINDETNEAEAMYFESELVVTQSKLPKRLVADWSLTEDY